MSTRWLVAILICFTVQGMAVAANFDCQKVRTATEKRICANPNISAMDAELDKLYEKALKSSDDPKSLRAEEIKWLKEARNKCTNDACLTKAYEARISELKITGIEPSGNAAQSLTHTTAPEMIVPEAASVEKTPKPKTQPIQTQTEVSGFSEIAKYLPSGNGLIVLTIAGAIVLIYLLVKLTLTINRHCDKKYNYRPFGLKGNGLARGYAGSSDAPRSRS